MELAREEEHVAEAESFGDLADGKTGLSEELTGAGKAGGDHAFLRALSDNFFENA